MLENVLKSISKMLERALDTLPKSGQSIPMEGKKVEIVPIGQAQAYVQCAKDLLDETIESFKKPFEKPSGQPPTEPLTPEGQEAREELMA